MTNSRDSKKFGERLRTIENHVRSRHARRTDSELPRLECLEDRFLLNATITPSKWAYGPGESAVLALAGYRRGEIVDFQQVPTGSAADS